MNVTKTRFKIATGVLEKMIYDSMAAKAAIPLESTNANLEEVHDLLIRIKELLKSAKDKLR